MTCSYPRRAIGYPFYQYVAGMGAVAAGATSTFSISGGPGEILGFGMMRYAGTIANFSIMNIKIVIDGVTIYDNYLAWLLGADLNYGFHALCSTNDIQSSAINCCSFEFMMAYESTAVLYFKNQGGASVSFGVGIHTRQGV